jgi:poly-gamma-glutamate synthase PgsB/CapB
MIVLLLCVAGLVLYLMIERVKIDRWRRAIPQTIIVTGTRGKSSVVRMLASVLRAEKRRVLAKTTGSSPRLLWPDGSETEIRRRGPASILEQKKLLRQAATRKVDTLVAEVMSIHPENHFVEAQQILKPDVVAVTNCWPDHIDAQGFTEEDVAATLCLGIPQQATVVVPAAAHSTVIVSAVEAVDGKLIVVDEDASKTIRQRVTVLEDVEFSGNVDLVYGLAKHLGIDDSSIEAGLATVKRDIGAFSVRTLRAGEPTKRLITVNAFGANDPTSTYLVLSKAREVLPEASHLVGLMCLRSDRPDRTAQWLASLQGEPSVPYDRLYVTGRHASVVARRVPIAQELRHGSPKSVMDTIASEADDDTVVFGFGNFVGMGETLVELWTREGVAYGI